MKILVTGATGQLGSKVIEALLKTVPADQLVVSVRNVEKAESLKVRGIEVRQGDFEDPNSLDTAFAGIDRLLLISSSEVRLGGDEVRLRQHLNAVAAAERAKVKFIAFTSAPNASDSNFFLAQVYKATEEAILNTGIPYSFLRNNWYLENEIGSIQGAIAGTPWMSAIGDAKVGWALRQDFAEAIATVMAGNGHENTIYELSGKQRTYRELVSILETVLGKEIPLQEVDIDTFEEIMKGSGIPEAYIPMLVSVQKGIGEDGLEVDHSDLEKLLGHPETPLEEALRQIVNELSQAII